MNLSRSGYFADFIVYPVLIIGLFWTTSEWEAVDQILDWLVTCAAGLGVWTLLEYAAHRFVLHHVPGFARLHALHHAAPTDLVGTPTWVSLPIIVATVLVPLLLTREFDLASGATAGVMAGYLWYTVVHHAIHHWHPRHHTYLYRAKHRHAMHHHSRQEGNYGVTTSLWDRAFGTMVPEKHSWL